MLLGPPAGSVAELDRAGAIARTLDAVADLWPTVIVDVGFALSPSDEPVAARIHREAIVTADAVVLVLGVREPQLRRGVAQLDLLLDDLDVPRERLRIVVNGIGAPGALDRRTIEQTVSAALAERRLAPDAWLAWDTRGLRRAQRLGQLIARARSHGPYARTMRPPARRPLPTTAPEPLPRDRKRPLPRTATPERRPGQLGDAARGGGAPWRPST